MAGTGRIRFYVGGPKFHPTRQQAEQAAAWLGTDYEYDYRDGLAAFEDLDACDLLVLMGLHWTGSKTAAGESNYVPIGDVHKRGFETYVTSGKPLLAHHGAVASFDDWPRYGELVGVTWVWETSTHSPLDRHTVQILSTGHALTRGLDDFEIYDELYYNLRLTPSMPAIVHAHAMWEGKGRPMLISASGGRADGAGKMVYMANGHDMRAYECPVMETIWKNAVNWLMS